MDDFERWWREYPRKTAKADARKAWIQTAAIRPALDEMIEVTRRACGCPDWCRDGGRFIPYPATWLRGERWSDEGVDVGLLQPAAAAKGPSEVDQQWMLVRVAMRADDPRQLTDARTRYAVAQIGWSTLQAMRADQVPFVAKDFARLFNAAPATPRATVHAFPARKAAHG